MELYNETERLQEQLDYLKKGMIYKKMGKNGKTIYEPGTKQSDYNIDKIERYCLKESSSGVKKNLQKLGTLKTLGYWLNKPFNEITEQEAKDYNYHLEKEAGIKFRTAEGYKQVINHFYKWLGMKNIAELFPRRKEAKDTNTLPEELLTNEDVSDLLRNATTTRNKAIISMLYESGCRISELRPIKLKHLYFEEAGLKIFLKGKTGTRRIMLRDSIPYIKKLINEHPEANNREAYLFLSNRKKMVGYNAIRTLLDSTFRKAGIQKKNNPHIFRHSRATYLANFLTEQQLKVYFGWSKNSNMAAVYVHLSGSNIDNALLSKVYQVKQIQEEAREDKLKPKECPRCNELNPNSYKFCSKCSIPLDIESQEKVDKVRNIIGQVVEELMNQKLPLTDHNIEQVGQPILQTTPLPK